MSSHDPLASAPPPAQSWGLSTDGQVSTWVAGIRTQVFVLAHHALLLTKASLRPLVMFS